MHRSTCGSPCRRRARSCQRTAAAPRRRAACCRPGSRLTCASPLRRASPSRATACAGRTARKLPPGLSRTQMRGAGRAGVATAGAGRRRLSPESCGSGWRGKFARRTGAGTRAHPTEHDTEREHGSDAVRPCGEEPDGRPHFPPRSPVSRQSAGARVLSPPPPLSPRTVSTGSAQNKKQAQLRDCRRGEGEVREGSGGAGGGVAAGLPAGRAIRRPVEHAAPRDARSAGARPAPVSPVSGLRGPPPRHG